MQPSAEYGGSIDGYNYYVSGDFLSTNHGIDGVTPALTQIHDQSEQLHAFAYLDKIIDGENRVTAVAGVFNGRFEIPNNPATPTFPGITFLNGTCGALASARGESPTGFMYSSRRIVPGGASFSARRKNGLRTARRKKS